MKRQLTRELAAQRHESLSRRQVLRGLGASIALPTLMSASPAFAKAVSMAGWVCPTANGASISFVYTPPELRGRGYGKAVTAALAGQMLAGGLKFISIRADTDDAQTNAMYQGIGAQTVGEFMRCTIGPPVPAAPSTPTSQAKPLVLL